MTRGSLSLKAHGVLASLLKKKLIKQLVIDGHTVVDMYQITKKGRELARKFS